MRLPSFLSDHCLQTIKETMKQKCYNDNYHYYFVVAVILFYHVFWHYIVLDNKWHLAGDLVILRSKHPVSGNKTTFNHSQKYTLCPNVMFNVAVESCWIILEFCFYPKKVRHKEWCQILNQIQDNNFSNQNKLCLDFY